VVGRLDRCTTGSDSAVTGHIIATGGGDRGDAVVVALSACRTH
jgi:hypothetical protein